MQLNKEQKQKIIDLSREVVDYPVDPENNLISGETKFKRDLGFNSIDLVELVMKVEKEFVIAVPDDDMESIESFSDLYNVVERLISKGF